MLAIGTYGLGQVREIVRLQPARISLKDSRPTRRERGWQACRSPSH